MSLFLNLFIGIIIGVGFIIPGVSGGAIAVIIGVYDKIFYCIKNFKNKKNLLFLLIISIGVVIGIIAFGNLLLLLFDKKEVPTKYIFIGLVIGGIPSLIKSVKEKSCENFKLWPLIMALIISGFLFVLEKNSSFINISSKMINGNVPIFGLFLAGILYAVGKIVPGISGSALLILVGMYEYFLKIVSNPFNMNIQDVLCIIPFGIGVVVGLIILFKLMNYLFAKHYINTYSAILGFVVGSLFYLYPGFSFDLSGFICLVLLVSSSLFSYTLTK